MKHEIRLSEEAQVLGPVSLTLDFSGDPAAALALGQNTPFSGDVTIGAGEIQLGTGDLPLRGLDGGKASFKAQAFGVFAVRTRASGAIAALRLAEDLADHLDLPTRDDRIFAVLGWGFDTEGSAAGSVALGGPSASLGFSVEGSAQGRYARICSFPARRRAAEVVDRTFRNFRLPGQIRVSRDIPNGTWLVVELNGALKAGISARVGYEFNWLREAQATGGLLEGTVGLKIEAGLKAAVGLELEGRFALVISRGLEGSNVRVRLIKRKVRGWNFALGLSAKADPTFEAPPLDDLVKAVLGTHHQEFIDALGTLEEWTAPGVGLSDRMAGFTSDYLQELVSEVTGLNLSTDFELARDAVLDLISVWKTLPQRVSEIIWTHVPIQDDLKAIREVVAEWSEKTRDELRDALQEKLAEIPFLEGPMGLLLAARFDDPLALLTDSGLLTELRDLLGKLRALLDEADVEKRLERLHEAVSARLGVDAIEKAVESNSFETVDAWVQARLSRFLDEELKLASVESFAKDVGKAIRQIKELGKKVYAETVAALNKDYTAELAYAYSKTTTRDALVDAEINLRTPAARRAFQQLINGDLDEILTKTIGGVTLHRATLTHAIRRTKSIEVTLPFASMKEESMNDVLAKVDAVDEDDGRLLLYTVDAKDTVTQRHIRTSSLALAAELPRLKGVADFGRSSSRLTYTLRQAVPDMKATHVRQQIGSYASAYLDSAFEGGQDWNTWVTALDQSIERKTRNGDETFGNTLLALELSAPASVASSWMAAPDDRTAAVYMRMSLALQEKLKEIIPFHYFGDPRHYVEDPRNSRAGRKIASALLLYAAIPPISSFEVRERRVRRTDGDIYWKHGNLLTDSSRIRALTREASFVQRLSALMTQAAERLRATAGLPGGRDLSRHAPSYHPDEHRREDVIVAGLPTLGANYERGLIHLLELEETIVHGAREAALRIAEFDMLAGGRPADAIKALAEFGAKVTNVFNEKVKSHYGGDALRPLGQLLFAEASRALGGDEGPLTAALEVFVIGDEVGFPAAAWLEGKRPTDGVLVGERLLASG